MTIQPNKLSNVSHKINPNSNPNSTASNRSQQEQPPLFGAASNLKLINNIENFVKRVPDSKNLLFLIRDGKTDIFKEKITQLKVEHMQRVKCVISKMNIDQSDQETFIKAIDYAISCRINTAQRTGEEVINIGMVSLIDATKVSLNHSTRKLKLRNVINFIKQNGGEIIGAANHNHGLKVKIGDEIIILCVKNTNDPYVQPAQLKAVEEAIQKISQKNPAQTKVYEESKSMELDYESSGNQPIATQAANIISVLDKDIDDSWFKVAADSRSKVKNNNEFTDANELNIEVSLNEENILIMADEDDKDNEGAIKDNLDEEDIFTMLIEKNYMSKQYIKVDECDKNIRNSLNNTDSFIWNAQADKNNKKPERILHRHVMYGDDNSSYNIEEIDYEFEYNQIMAENSREITAMLNPANEDRGIALRKFVAVLNEISKRCEKKIDFTVGDVICELEYNSGNDLGLIYSALAGLFSTLKRHDIACRLLLVGLIKTKDYIICGEVLYKSLTELVVSKNMTAYSKVTLFVYLKFIEDYLAQKKRNPEDHSLYKYVLAHRCRMLLDGILINKDVDKALALINNELKPSLEYIEEIKKQYDEKEAKRMAPAIKRGKTLSAGNKTQLAKIGLLITAHFEHRANNAVKLIKWYKHYDEIESFYQIFDTDKLIELYKEALENYEIALGTYMFIVGSLKLDSAKYFPDSGKYIKVIKNTDESKLRLNGLADKCIDLATLLYKKAGEQFLRETEREEYISVILEILEKVSDLKRKLFNDLILK